MGSSQLRRASKDQMHWYHHRDPTRLLSQASSEVSIYPARALLHSLTSLLLSSMLRYGCTRLEVRNKGRVA